MICRTRSNNIAGVFSKADSISRTDKAADISQTNRFGKNGGCSRASMNGKITGAGKISRASRPDNIDRTGMLNKPGGLRTICAVAAFLLFLIFPVFLHPTESFAVNTSGNVYADSADKAAKKGDEIRIKVSAKKMSVSTFIASVEYDPDVLEYKGYEGTSGGKSVYLSDASDKDVHFDIAVEKSDSEPVIGMYAIGTSDKKYSAAKPLLTLIFTAKKDSEVYYRVSESTSGKDGYTSPDIEKRSDKSLTSQHQDTDASDVNDGEESTAAEAGSASSDTGVDADTTVDAHSAGNKPILLTAALAAAAALMLAAAMLIMRKLRMRRMDLKDK